MATIIGSTNTSVWTFKLETTEGVYDIANNTSPLTVDIYIGRISSSGSYMTGARISGEVACTGCTNLAFAYNNSGTLNIAAGKWAKIASVTFPAVPHNIDGSKTAYVSASFTSNISPKSGSAAGNVALTTIPRQATLTSAPDFTDEENPTIYFNNPAGTAATVKVCISFTGKNDDIKYYTLPDPTVTSYTFPLDEIIEGDTRTGHEILRAGTTSGKTYRFVTFFVTTIIGDVTYYSTLQRTYTVVNCAPELNPIVEDMGDHSYKLTNNRSKLIRYFNYPKITFHATPKKGADIVNSSVTCGSQTKNIDGDHVYLNNVDSDTFIVSVTDNRGITVTKEIKMDMIPYVNLTCNTEINTELGTDNTNSIIHLTATGDFYIGSFGAVKNGLIVEYRYKSSSTDYPTDKSGNEIWTKILEIDSIESEYVSDYKYSISADVEDVDYTKTYTIQVRARDNICTWSVHAKDEIVKMVPVFDWSENDFNFNVPVTIQGKKIRTDGPNSTNRIARAYTQETDIAYEANSYIKLLRSNSPTDLYNTDIATFQENGLITINKDMIALVNIHILSGNPNNRSYIMLWNYITGWKQTECIQYGEFTTSQITTVLSLSKGDVFGIRTVEPINIHASGLAGSYIEIIEL